MTAIAYAHPTISRFAIADGMLHIGGLPVGLLAERAGATPLFAYERTGLTGPVGELRRALPDDIHLSFAVKANPMPAVVQHFSRQVDGFDVASAGEMAVGLDPPIPADRVSFAGPGKTPAELGRAVAARGRSASNRRPKGCLPRAEIGDLAAVFQAGVYGTTTSPTASLGHPTPTELLV